MYSLSTPIKINGQSTQEDITIPWIGIYQRTGDSNCIFSAGICNENTGQSITANSFNFYLVTIYKRQRITYLTINVTATGTNVRIAIYKKTKGEYPSGELLVDSGNINVTTTGQKIVNISPMILDPGQYWFAVNADATATIKEYGDIPDNYSGESFQSPLAFSFNFTFGAFPNKIPYNRSITQSTITPLFSFG